MISNSKPLHKPSSGTLYPQLDGLRALAIMSVVFGHILYFNPNASKFQALLQAVKTTGGMGVSIFFVLSGFLITQSLLRMGSKLDLFAYSVRRIAKIYPPFLLSMLVFSCFIAYFGKSEGLLSALVANLASIPNFICGFREINPVHWSLWVEIQFYIIFPLLCLILGGISPRNTTIIAITFLVSSFVSRMIVYLAVDRTGIEMPVWNHLLQRTPGSLDGFSFGMIFASIFQSSNHNNFVKLKHASILSWIGIFLLVLTYALYTALEYRYAITGKPNPIVWETFRFLPCLAIFLALFMLYLPSSHPLSRFFSYSPLCFVGLVSYEWYLLHYLPAHYLSELIGPSEGDIGKFLLKTVVPILSTFGLSVVMYYFYSVPILRSSKKYLLSHAIRKKSSDV